VDWERGWRASSQPNIYPRFRLTTPPLNSSTSQTSTEQTSTASLLREGSGSKLHHRTLHSSLPLNL